MNHKVKRGLGVAASIGLIAGVAFFFMPEILGQQGAKEISIKVLLPNAKAKVTIDAKPFAGQGTERTITLVTSKKELNVSATWDPNNYTQFIRSRKVEVKEGVVADLRKEDPKNPDKIQILFVPTPEDVVEEMCKLAKVSKDDVVYDLGCGDGRIVITALKKFHAKRGVGIDTDPDLVEVSIENAASQGVADKVEFREGDVLKVRDLSDANVVMLYMGDDVNLRLRPILQKTLKPGSRVVSHRFTMGDWKATKSVKFKAEDGDDYDLHLWVIEAKGPAVVPKKNSP